MKTINEHWMEYYAAWFPYDNASDNEKDDTQRAFYAGSLVALTAVIDLLNDTQDEAESTSASDAVKSLITLYKETASWIEAEIAKGLN